MRQYLKMDFYRAFINIKFICVVIALAILPFIAVAEYQDYSLVGLLENRSIFDYFMKTTYFSEIGIFNFILVACLYSDCMCDDLSVKNYIYSITRGNDTKYILSKIITVFFASILTYALSMFVFAASSSILFDFRWHIGEENADFMINSCLDSPVFSGMLKGNHYFIFFLCCVLLQALLYGITSLGSLLVSMFIKNKLLILCVPVLMITVGNYLLAYFVPTYSGYKDVFAVDMLPQKSIATLIFQIILPCILIVVVIGVIIKIKLRRTIIE